MVITWCDRSFWLRGLDIHRRRRSWYVLKLGIQVLVSQWGHVRCL